MRLLIPGKMFRIVCTHIFHRGLLESHGLTMGGPSYLCSCVRARSASEVFRNIRVSIGASDSIDILD